MVRSCEERVSKLPHLANSPQKRYFGSVGKLWRISIRHQAAKHTLSGRVFAPRSFKGSLNLRLSPLVELILIVIGASGDADPGPAEAMTTG